MSGSNLGRVGESYVSSSGRPDEMLGTYTPFPAGKEGLHSCIFCV